MDDRFNTIAGWVLFAGIVALGSSIVAGEMFHSERPEKMGYPIAGVEQDSRDPRSRDVLRRAVAGDLKNIGIPRHREQVIVRRSCDRHDALVIHACDQR